MVIKASKDAQQPTFFAAIRLKRIKTMRLLQSATDHANRMDAISQTRVRDGADRLNNLALNPYAAERRAESGAINDYVADFKQMKKLTNVSERGKTAPVSHLIAVVSPEWIAKTGDVHDPANPRNRKLFDTAIGWARKNFGDEALISARMDLDEKGAGVVDLLVAAVARSKKGKSYLSISPRLKEIQFQYKARNTFAGLQDSWAEYVQTHVDPLIQRGKEKESRGPDRLSPENFGAKKEIEKAQKKLEAEKEAMALERRKLDDEKQRIETSRNDIQDQRQRLDLLSRDLDDQRDKIVETKMRQRAALAKIDQERSELEKRRAVLNDQILSERQAARQQGLEEGRKKAQAEAASEFELARKRGLVQGRSEAAQESRIRAKHMQIVTTAVIQDEILEVAMEGMLPELKPDLDPKKREELVAAFDGLPRTDQMVIGALAATKRFGEEKVRKQREDVDRTAEKLYARVRERAEKDGFLLATQIIGKAFHQGVLALLENRITVKLSGEGAERKFIIVATEGQKDDEHQKLMGQLAPAMDYGLTNLLKHIAVVLARAGEAAAAVKKGLSAVLRQSPDRDVPAR